jgi:hypothetical protein
MQPPQQPRGFRRVLKALSSPLRLFCHRAIQSERYEIALPDTARMPDQRCSTRNSDVSIPGLDLSGAEWLTIPMGPFLWLGGAEHDCALCRIIAAVFRNAEETFHCIFGFMSVELKPATDGQYGLYLDGVLMPLPSQQLGNAGFPGSIAIYLRGQPYCILGDVSN